jgi:pimeloyl-ACP methyl ester carboxylesterase
MSTEQYVKVGNINTHFRIEGEKGPAVILVHGLGGSVENWDANMTALGRKHRVYAVDLPGFGRSDKLMIKSIFELTTFLDNFMENQHIDKASLIGNSMGGGLALYLAIQCPQNVEKLVLVDNAGMGKELGFTLRLLTLPMVGELLTRPSRKSMTKLLREIVYEPTLITDQVMENAYQLAIMPDAMKALLATARAGINVFGQKSELTRTILKGLAGMKTPTLIVWGRNDRITPVSHAQVAASKISNARLHIFDRCGHMPQLEHPEEFNKLVMDFLAE